MLTLYGIPNCDSVRKTRRYLDAHDIPYRFIDLRVEPPATVRLETWYAAFGDKLLNKNSTTYRENRAQASAALATGKNELLALLQRYPTLIKRPVIEDNGFPVLLGWNESALQALTKKRSKNLP